jgi:hypothetical protein
MVAITPGRYRHYKGNEYTVLGIARHSETLEELVVYRQEYGDRGLWVRPAAMFAETVVVETTVAETAVTETAAAEKTTIARDTAHDQPTMRADANSTTFNKVINAHIASPLCTAPSKVLRFDAPAFPSPTSAAKKATAKTAVSETAAAETAAETAVVKSAVVETAVVETAVVETAVVEITVAVEAAVA